MGGYLVIDSPSERIFSGGASHHHVTYPLLAIMLPFYVILTQLVKTWFYRRFGD
jgi:hypothetical protein